MSIYLTPQDGQTHLTEDNTLPDRKQLVQGDENIIFVLLVSAVHIELPYSFNGELFLLQLNLIRIWSKFARKGTDVVWKGG